MTDLLDEGALERVIQRIQLGYNVLEPVTPANRGTDSTAQLVNTLIKHIQGS